MASLSNGFLEIYQSFKTHFSKNWWVYLWVNWSGIFRSLKMLKFQPSSKIFPVLGNVITSQIDYLNPAPPNEDAWNCGFFHLIQKSSVSFLYKPKIKVCRSWSTVLIVFYYRLHDFCNLIFRRFILVCPNKIINSVKDKNLHNQYLRNMVDFSSNN